MHVKVFGQGSISKRTVDHEVRVIANRIYNSCLISALGRLVGRATPWVSVDANGRGLRSFLLSVLSILFLFGNQGPLLQGEIGQRAFARPRTDFTGTFLRANVTYGATRDHGRTLLIPGQGGVSVCTVIGSRTNPAS